MKLLRSHWVKKMVLGVLLIGLCSNAALASSRSYSKNAFKYWLKGLVKQHSGEAISNQLQSLEGTSADLHELISQATQIIANHGEEFSLPANKSAGALQQMLLSGWNRFETGSAMAGVPAPPAPKSLLAGTYLKMAFLGVMQPSPVAQNDVRYCAVDFRFSSPRCFGLMAPPMISGIAIGAP